MSGAGPLHERRKRQVERLLAHPRTEMALVGLILFSVLVVLVEVAFVPGSPTHTALTRLGNGLSLLFAIELSLRFWIAPSKRRFFKRYSLDILSVLPVLPPLRLLRALFVLRLFRAGMLLNRRLSVLGGLFTTTFHEVTTLLTLSTMIVLVAATTLHLVTGSVATEALGLEGSLWFSVFTLLGSEPIGGAPQTTLGRSVSLALVLGGSTVFAVFVGTVSAAMARVLDSRAEVNEMEIAELRGHVVVCGWNRAGPALVQEFFAPATHHPCEAMVLITEGEKLPANFPTRGVPPERIYHLRGDHTQVAVLEQAGIARSSVAILLDDAVNPRPSADRDARTVLAALTIERLAKDVFCVAQLNSEQHEPLLRMYGVEEIVIGDWYTGAILGSIGRNHGLVAVLADILSTQQGNAFHKLVLPPSLNGKTVADLHHSLKHEHDAILISVERLTPKRELHVNPACDFVLQTHDVAVIIARSPVTL